METTMNQITIELPLSVDDCQVSLSDLMASVGNVDDLIKAYLFRGWFISELNGGRIPTVDRCPCCNQQFNKNDNSNNNKTSF